MSALGDLPPEAVSAAVTRCLCERIYPTVPAPGDIRRLAVKWMGGESISSDQAFGLLLETVHRIGASIPTDSSRAKELLGPSIWTVVKGLGGWTACCDFPSDQRATLRAQFRDAWHRLVEQVETRLRLPQGIAPKLVQPHEAVKNLAAAMDAT